MANSTATNHLSSDEYTVGDVSGVGIAIGRGASVTVHQVQIFHAPTNNEMLQGYGQDKLAAPYLLNNFSARERTLFTGREREIKQSINLLNSQEFIVGLQGTAGVGKTSLIVAGIIPQLVRHGDLVIHLKDYVPPLVNLREALQALVQELQLSPEASAPLPQMAQAIFSKSQKPLIIILDQVERLFERTISNEEREEFLDTLIKIGESLPEQYYRLIFAIRKEAANHLGELEEQIPGALNNSIEVMPLTREEAQLAINQPVKVLDYPVSYVEPFVEEYLVPDLDKLTPDMQGRIQPVELQIVCHTLYQAAFGEGPGHINRNLYLQVSDGKRAKGIMANHLRGRLKISFATQWEEMQQILKEIASLGDESWIQMKQLNSLRNNPAATSIIDRLIAADFLIPRSVKGSAEFRFASHAIATTARNLVDERIINAPLGLNRIWQGWLRDEDLATSKQVQRLGEAKDLLAPTPVQVVLLLLSTVANRQSPKPWFTLIQEHPNSDLIQSLEEPNNPKVRKSNDEEDREDGAGLIGVATEKNQVPESDRFGPVAWTAATHIDPIKRQTAALALQGAYPHAALTKLANAITHAGQGWNRRSELRGVLAEAEPEIEKINKREGFLTRLGIWWWRFRRRLYRDRHRIVLAVLGGAIGAGLGLGLWRAVTARMANLSMPIHFFISSYLGFILGAMLTLGLVLAPSIRLREDTEDDKFPYTAVILGALFFGIGHFLIAMVNGLPLLSNDGVPLPSLLTLFFGFVAGLVLSIALHDQPTKGLQIGLGHWVLRLGMVAGVFALIQFVFKQMQINTASLSFVWPPATFQAFAQYMFRSNYESVADWAAIVDAAVVGVVLTVGIAVGLTWGRRLLTRWNS